MAIFKTTFLVLSCLLASACSDSLSASKKPSSGKKKEMDGEANPAGGIDPGNEVIGCPKYPMVFLHGFMGGNRLGNFAGVTKHFQAKGCKVFVAEVSPVNGIEFRGRQFAAQVGKFLQSAGLSKVNIIAHSQGGLDARYAISSLNLGASVASLSMLSTPNLGTPIADFALSNTSDPFSQTLVSALLSMMSSVSNSQNSASNNSQAALKSLSTSYLIDTFNPANKDFAGVYYQSWGARSGKGTSDQIKFTLAITQPIITNKAGENDGVVPVSSAKWGEFRGTLEADHLDLVGLKLEDASSSKFDHLKFLDELARGLASKGF
jgi:triacylglycerol lipase